MRGEFMRDGGSVLRSSERGLEYLWAGWTS